MVFESLLLVPLHPVTAAVKDVQFRARDGLQQEERALQRDAAEAEAQAREYAEFTGSYASSLENCWALTKGICATRTA